MIRWNLHIAETCHFTLSTIEIATYLLDQFVALQSTRSPPTTTTTPSLMTRHVASNARTFQLASMTCLYIAAKVHEEQCLTPVQLETMSNGRFVAMDLVHMEVAILTCLKWRVNPPTASGMLRLFFLAPCWARDVKCPTNTTTRTTTSHLRHNLLQVAEAHIELAMVTESIIPLDTLSVAVACWNLALGSFGLLDKVSSSPLPVLLQQQSQSPSHPSTPVAHIMLMTTRTRTVQWIQKELSTIISEALGGGAGGGMAASDGVDTNAGLLLSPILIHAYQQQQQQQKQQRAARTSPRLSSSPSSIVRPHEMDHPSRPGKEEEPSHPRDEQQQQQQQQQHLCGRSDSHQQQQQQPPQPQEAPLSSSSPRSVLLGGGATAATSTAATGSTPAATTTTATTLIGGYVPIVSVHT